MSDPHMYHVGHPPPNVRHILDRVKRGLPTYLPTDPKPCDQLALCYRTGTEQ